MDEIVIRRKTEERLLQNNEKFRNFILQSSKGIAVIEFDKMTFIECNETAKKILSFADVKLSDMMNRINGHKNYSELSETIQSIISFKTKPIKKVIEIQVGESTKRKLGISVSWADFGDMQYIIITMQDITDQLIMEERKQHVAKMEALGTLSSGIAHDFNNILAGIMGYTELTREELRLKQIKDLSLSENLTEILKLGDRAKNIISQILTFSRSTPETKEKTNLGLIIEEAVKMLRTTVPANITLQYRKPDYPCYIYANTSEMHQLIINLCVNAELAYEDTAGTVEIRISDIVADCTLMKEYNLKKAGHYIQLEVEDDGCGMDEEVKKRIFEPFFTKRGSNRGTGLGLSVVHGIVNRLDGAIKVCSEPGKGSTFFILLPMYLDSDIRYNLTERSSELSMVNILLVDDEEPIVTSVKKILSRHGYLITGVTSAREAKSLFDMQPDSYDLLLTDQLMPDMTGDELLKELRKVRPELPAVICSGFINRQSDGGDNTVYLRKPASSDDYIAAIEKLQISIK
jgi:signal transduction histidine kinase/CheY-like chemotaxis protein